jgi:hypothetical protein
MFGAMEGLTTIRGSALAIIGTESSINTTKTDHLFVINWLLHLEGNWFERVEYSRVAIDLLSDEPGMPGESITTFRDLILVSESNPDGRRLEEPVLSVFA